ncbi:unnamed protein product [Amoebophrya sp. A120]|nr:unnamed protein product [Amoebophrya sp. A120]|eukprot:GSA120T00005199001.1
MAWDYVPEDPDDPGQQLQAKVAQVKQRNDEHYIAALQLIEQHCEDDEHCENFYQYLWRELQDRCEQCAVPEERLKGVEVWALLLLVDDAYDLLCSDTAWRFMWVCCKERHLGSGIPRLWRRWKSRTFAAHWEQQERSGSLAPDLHRELLGLDTRMRHVWHDRPFQRFWLLTETGEDLPEAQRRQEQWNDEERLLYAIDRLDYTQKKIVSTTRTTATANDTSTTSTSTSARATGRTHRWHTPKLSKQDGEKLYLNETLVDPKALANMMDKTAAKLEEFDPQPKDRCPEKEHLQTIAADYYKFQEKFEENGGNLNSDYYLRLAVQDEDIEWNEEVVSTAARNNMVEDVGSLSHLQFEDEDEDVSTNTAGGENDPKRPHQSSAAAASLLLQPSAPQAVKLKKVKPEPNACFSLLDLQNFGFYEHPEDKAQRAEADVQIAIQHRNRVYAERELERNVLQKLRVELRKLRTARSYLKTVVVSSRYSRATGKSGHTSYAKVKKPRPATYVKASQGVKVDAKSVKDSMLPQKFPPAYSRPPVWSIGVVVEHNNEEHDLQLRGPAEKLRLLLSANSYSASEESKRADAVLACAKPVRFWSGATSSSSSTLFLDSTTGDKDNATTPLGPQISSSSSSSADEGFDNKLPTIPENGDVEMLDSGATGDTFKLKKRKLVAATGASTSSAASAASSQAPARNPGKKVSASAGQVKNAGTGGSSSGPAAQGVADADEHGDRSAAASVGASSSSSSSHQENAETPGEDVDFYRPYTFDLNSQPVPIFTPSARRPKKALLNYFGHHCFGEAAHRDIVHVVVVEPNEYEEYHAHFPEHVFLVLDRNEMGLGYARYMIQCFCTNSLLGLDLSAQPQESLTSPAEQRRKFRDMVALPFCSAFCWMIDDMVARFYKTERKKQVPSIVQASGGSSSSGGVAGDNNLSQAKQSQVGRQETTWLESLLKIQRHGDVSKLGVAGFLRDNGAVVAHLNTREWNNQAFKLYKAVFLNIAELQKRDVFYVPYQKLWEDLAFLVKTVNADLPVLKCQSHFYFAFTSRKGGCEEQRAHEKVDLMTRDRLVPEEHWSDLSSKDQKVVTTVLEWVRGREEQFLGTKSDEDTLWAELKAKLQDWRESRANSLMSNRTNGGAGSSSSLLNTGKKS